MSIWYNGSCHMLATCGYNISHFRSFRPSKERDQKTHCNKIDIQVKRSGI